ncbi:hypothetical protein TNIN_243271 [Trichonephila inaurata madagascariensis]|uniref:Uncharacterized protein n=1 Tax=Trichonephila inaurata madagascariensis TaxID=2747483 RepID=A0A8X6WR04_9ARAC|nr:hypothetical protein TNIN_243271 [Trichonephila inaurata madagascariensis]
MEKGGDDKRDRSDVRILASFLEYDSRIKKTARIIKQSISIEACIEFGRVELPWGRGMIEMKRHVTPTTQVDEAACRIGPVGLPYLPRLRSHDPFLSIA